MKQAMRKLNRSGILDRLVPVPCRLREGGDVDSLQDESNQTLGKRHIISCVKHRERETESKWCKEGLVMVE